MEAGNYKHYPKWSKYEVDMLPIHWYDSAKFVNCGCGSTALATITGINPVKIQRVWQFSLFQKLSIILLK
jgi:hypothetical protein